MSRGQLHHVELWVPRLDDATASFGWLLGELGYELFQSWERGRSWRLGTVYVVLEQSPALTADTYDRRRPGLNHLAFHAGSTGQVDELVRVAPHHGWKLLFAETHPYAGGPEHYAAYLSTNDGFEVELVAESPGT